MNEIVHKRYPANRLPEDIRQGIPAGSEIDVTITVHPARRRVNIADLVGTGRNVHGDEAGVMAYLRALRDEE